MLELRPISCRTIQHFFVDFQKKSRYFALPIDGAEYTGIFQDDKLIGYFITLGQGGEIVEIEQGYLIKEARHSALPRQCMNLLETAIKQAGYKTIRIGTVNRFKSYTKFMSSLGYKPERIIYSKKVN